MTDTRNPKLTRELIAQSDFIKLWSQPEFRRFLFTVLDLSGMYASSFHSDGRIHAYREGRRSLGLDILRTAEANAGREAAMLILAEEMKTPLEADNAKFQYTDDDEPDEPERGEPCSAPGVLRYDEPS